MKNLLATLFSIAVFSINSVNAAPSDDYQKSLDLIHAYSGGGNELDEAQAIALNLLKTEPKSGYGEILFAEMISAWQLNYRGEPDVMANEAVKLAEAGLKANPTLAQGHVVLGRIYFKQNNFAKLDIEIKHALSLSPQLSGALYLQADVHKRYRRYDDAEEWFLKFIQSVASKERKSNGYHAIAEMYRDVALRKEPLRATALIKAKSYYGKSVDFHPEGAWKLANAALFLNHFALETTLAIEYSKRALAVMSFPMAHYQLAIARYIQLQTNNADANKVTLLKSMSQIQAETKISLDDSLKFIETKDDGKAALLALRSKTD